MENTTTPVNTGGCRTHSSRLPSFHPGPPLLLQPTARKATACPRWPPPASGSTRTRSGSAGSPQRRWAPEAVPLLGRSGRFLLARRQQMSKRTLSGRKPRTKRLRTRRHGTRSSCRRGGGRGAKRGGARNTTRDSILFPYYPILQTNVLRSVTSDLDLPLALDPADFQLVKSLDIDQSRAEGNQTSKVVMQGGKRRTRRDRRCCKRGKGRCWCAVGCGCGPRCGCGCRRRGCDVPMRGGCGCGCGCGGGKPCRCGSGCGCGCRRRRSTRRKTSSKGGRRCCASLRGGAAPGPLKSLWWDVRDTVDRVGSAAIGSPLAGRVRGIPKFIGKQIDLAPKWLPGSGR